MRKNKLKIDKRIIQAIEEYGAKEIKISSNNYEKLKRETKGYIKLNNVKVAFDNKTKGFKAIF